jgi:MoaA/NifB/PqqE/SkfB family radical SAM enzyme
MIEYRPWSKDVVQGALESMRQGVFSTLDIELSGKCPYDCIYCETPYRDKKSLIDFSKIEYLLGTKSFKWVYICGIGEPTYDCNEDYLLRILSSCKENGARCSIFTNLSSLTESLIHYVSDGTLCLIIKYDSLDPEKVKTIYNSCNVDTYFRNLEIVYGIVSVTENKTNIAASIVPTSYNIEEIDSLVGSCVERGIFPLLGQLEYSGSAKNVFDTISLDNKTLISQKERIEKIIGEEYHIPFCPSVITGLHVSNENKITIDHRTGLSCHWFWLDEPNVDILCDLSDVSDFRDVSNKLIEIRKNRFAEFMEIKDSLVADIFGGCGGNKKDIFDVYLKLMEGIGHVKR